MSQDIAQLIEDCRYAEHVLDDRVVELLSRAADALESLQRQLAEQTAIADNRDSIAVNLRNDIREMQKQLCQQAAVIEKKDEALVAMRDEFRALDLPYGSAAYRQCNEALALALAASPEILRQRDAETVRKFFAAWLIELEKQEPPSFGRFVEAYAQRIEKGEQV